MYKILMIGPPGSGKGTQAERLSARLKIPAISMGRLLRQLAGQNTPFGHQVALAINAGEMLSDDETNKIIRERLTQADVADGYILDGFPRRVNQLNLLLKIDQPTHAVLINLDDDLTAERIAGRRTCLICGRVYHQQYNPPPVGQCFCGGKPIQREDDTLPAIRQRLTIYHQQTEPLIESYRTMGILIDVDGSGSIEEVAEEIINKLGA